MAIGVLGPLLFIGVVLGVKWKRQVTIDKDKKDKNSTVEGPHSVNIVVVGGGVVGLACSRECAVRGASVILIEKENALAAGASSGNSGLLCTGYDAPVGSLERRLLRRSCQLTPALYRSFGISSDQHMRKSGSLVVAWNPAQLAQLPSVLYENRMAGDTEAVLLSRQQLRQMEPALSYEALGAVFCPRETVVEPWLVPMGYAESARLHGVDIRFNTKVVNASFDGSNWCLTTVKSGIHEQEHLNSGRSKPGELLTTYTPPTPPPPNDSQGEVIKARVVINCAGLYGDNVEDLCDGDLCTDGDICDDDIKSNKQKKKQQFSIVPRKGQFVVFKPKANAKTPEMIIEPVATQFTKGVIAWTTLHGQVIVGPTAEDQLSREDRSTDDKTIDMLRQQGVAMIPSLKEAAVIGTYAGLRPATEHRDYQIYANHQKRWITVGGIRSTGLTASSGIAEYVADLYDRIMSGKLNGTVVMDRDRDRDGDRDTNKAPDGLMGVTHCVANPLPLPLHPHPHSHNNRSCSQVPCLAEMAADYQSHLKSGDGQKGTVLLYGKRVRVTHPITSFGLEHYTVGLGGIVDCR